MKTENNKILRSIEALVVGIALTAISGYIGYVKRAVALYHINENDRPGKYNFYFIEREPEIETLKTIDSINGTFEIPEKYLNNFHKQNKK